MRVIYLAIIFNLVFVAYAKAQHFGEMPQEELEKYIAPVDVKFNFNEDPFANRKIQPKVEEPIIPEGKISLTSSIVKDLYRRNNNLNWNNFEKFKSVPKPESDDNIDRVMKFTFEEYPLENGMVLVVGGPSKKIPPRYITITDGQGSVLEIIKNDEF